MTKTTDTSEAKGSGLSGFLLSDQEQVALEQRIVDLVASKETVSWVEIVQHLGEKASGDFELSWEGKSFSNIVLWSGISKEVSDAVLNMMNEKRIHPHVAATLVYLCDGAMMKLPIAKSIRHYKKPHWLPVVYCSYPMAATPMKR